MLYFKKNLFLIIFLFLYRCTFTFSICCLNEERDNIKSSDLFALMENENKKFYNDLKFYLGSIKLKSLTFDVFTSEVCELLVKGVNNIDFDSIDKCKKIENENLRKVLKCLKKNKFLFLKYIDLVKTKNFDKIQPLIVIVTISNSVNLSDEQLKVYKDELAKKLKNRVNYSEILTYEDVSYKGYSIL